MEAENHANNTVVQWNGPPAKVVSVSSLQGFKWHVHFSQVLERSFPALGGRADCLVLRSLLSVGGSPFWDHQNSPAQDGGFPYPIKLMRERLELGENSPGAS